MITIKVVLDRPKKDGQVQVRIRATYQRKSIYLTTSIFITVKDFNPKGHVGAGNWIRPSHRLSIQHNLYLVERIGVLTRMAQTHMDNGTFRLDMLRNYKVGGKQLLEFIDEFIVNSGGKDRWVEKYTNIKNKLSAYRNGEDIPLASVDYEFIMGFRGYCIGIGNQPTTVQRTLSFVRTILHAAVKYGHLKHEQNPFQHIPLPAPKVNKERLTPEEMKRILEYESDNPYLANAAKMFVFQFFAAGIRIGDALQLKNQNLEGNLLRYTMDKTGTVREIPLSEKAMEAIAYLRGDRLNTNPDAYLFNYLDGVWGKSEAEIHRKISAITFRINRNLKTVAKETGITKKLTTHISRHTFADQARKATKDVYAISKTLGHSNLRITENYINSFDQDEVSDLMEKMFPPKPL